MLPQFLISFIVFVLALVVVAVSWRVGVAAWIGVVPVSTGATIISRSEDGTDAAAAAAVTLGSSMALFACSCGEAMSEAVSVALVEVGWLVGEMNKRE